MSIIKTKIKQICLRLQFKMLKQLLIKNWKFRWTFQQFLHKYWWKIAKKIPPTKKHFSSYLKNPNNLTFFITLTTVEEVYVLISCLKASKSTETGSLSTKGMKQLNDIIALPLVYFVNKSFQSGIFPIFSKLLRLFQSLKVSRDYSPVTLVQYLCSQRLAN